MTGLSQLADEFAITITNGEVWLSIGQGLLFGGVCLLFGIGVARTVGVLPRDAPHGDTFGVGLATGLLVIAGWWAAIWSGGRSSFTPVAVGFAIAIALALADRVRGRVADAHASAGASSNVAADVAAERSRRRSIVLTALGGGLFVVAVALLYGSTLAPSPRNGVQPVENRDEAFYAVLARDLATTGTETNILPSGFTEIPGAPAQLWYHWGELWLASAVITISGAAPLTARYFIVLPIVLLAAAALTGALVRRLTRTNSRRAYAFGFAACLLLAPVPLIPGPFFSSWAVGMIFGVTLYGMGAVAALLGLYSVAVLSSRRATWPLAAFVGSSVAFILPAHLAIAVLALVGTGGVWAIRIIQAAVATRRLPAVSPIWGRALISAGVAIGATIVWGTLTGHGIGGSSSTSVASPTGVSAATVIFPFDAIWRASVVIPLLGAGAFLAIPIAWFLRRREAPAEAGLYLGTVVLLVAGAIGWGFRLGDFTMFYLFFAGIAAFATPVAAVAIRTVWERLTATRHQGLAAGLVALCLIQLGLGVPSQILRLQGWGPPGYEPISLSLLRAIRQLPSDAKLAYSCEPNDEVAFGTPQLLSIDAHTSRRVVPMCFEAELPNTLLGAEFSKQIPSQFFTGAPQMALYPDAAAHPSSAAVTAFLKDHGIDYIYADAKHPSTLVENAVPVARSGEVEVLRVP